MSRKPLVVILLDLNLPRNGFSAPNLYKPERLMLQPGQLLRAPVLT